MQQHPPGAGPLLGMLSPGARKLEGKSFYLDAVKSRSAALLVEAISHLGGSIENFLNKDVSFVVTGNQEGLRDRRSEVTRGGSDGMSGEVLSSPHFTKQPDARQRPGTPRPTVFGSRGKVLLEKAIRNNERLQGSSVLANARSWGVKIVHVDDFLSYMQVLTAESSRVKRRKSELLQKNANKYPASHVVKAGALKSPYLKIEDSCRKYKPVHMQSMTFPTLCYSGRFSPFEPPPPPRPETAKEQGPKKAREGRTSKDKPQTPFPLIPSPFRPRKKNLGYCECCHEPFKDQDEHLQSDRHRGFVQDSSNFSVLDQLVTDLQPGFDSYPPEPAPDLLRSVTPSPLPPPSPFELESHANSETEHAIQALLTQVSPSNTLDQMDLLTRPPTPSLAAPPPDTQPLFSCPDTFGQPFSPYSQPPILSPQTMDSVYSLDALSEHPNPYSLPPVLSPQVLLQPQNPHQLTEDEDMEMSNLISASEEVEPAPQTVPAVSVHVPTPFLPYDGEDRTGRVMGLNQDGPDHSLAWSGVGASRSCFLPRLWSTTVNPKKRSRSVSPDLNASKRRKSSLTKCQRSDPIYGSSAGLTRQEHQLLISSIHTEYELVAKTCSLPKEPSYQSPVDTCGTADHKPIVERLDVSGSPQMISQAQQGIDSGRTFIPSASCFSVPNSGLDHATWPSLQGDWTTNVLNGEVLASKPQVSITSPSLCIKNFPQLPMQAMEDPSCHRDPSMDIGTGQQHCLVAPNTRLFSPPLFPSRDKTHCPPSSQDSHPSLSQSFSSVCIESALLPNLSTLSPSSSDSDWDCELLSRLAPAPALPLQRTGGSCGLDLEMLQKPCNWTHNTSYESRLCSALQPPSPPPSLCGEATEPSLFSRTVMQSLEVQH